MNAALMHAATKLLQEPPNPEGNAGYTPAAANNSAEDAPAAANNSAEDAPAAHSVERTPTASARAWHYSAMSAATCALSALLGYIATEAIFKRIRGRN